MTFSFSDTVLGWYHQHGRKHLPWQQDITPYRVWVSEIMLQQTQVSTVIAYYERFMQRFPDVFALAKAEQDEVLHLWTGLGYYARGRNLHACAKAVVNQYDGHFPEDLDALEQLPGIGRSTAAAIASISMGMRAAIMDGNVKRVLTRFYAIEGWPGQTAINKQLWQLAESLAPEHSFREYTQGMMDLGATLCTRSKPACGICPLQPQCAGYASGNPTQFPNPKPKKEKPEKHTIMLMIENSAGERWLYQRPQQGLWGGLWSFPEVADEQEALAWLRQNLGLEPREMNWLPTFRHTFSHYHLHIQPLHVRFNGGAQTVQQGQGHWYNPTKPSELGLAAPVKKLLRSQL
ncbi:A/G-specific adenine glycosylase [Bacterioplanes sanyensis]|uniref:A/G-specific adenine glycosylase n=1 Tax=Bacterioplanes sanyensis TaxID=1249553 RepID=UPI0019ADA132|nr:A/G-specific adenine glycosylase [Bacterioplanes sanyensis]GGY35991.1 A/G-specific adenine glycosylase [Bacterioplanes sanyensis]